MSIVVNWVDDYGTKCGAILSKHETVLAFEDANGIWRKVCPADFRHREYYDFLIREGRAHGKSIIAPKVTRHG